MMQRTHRLAEVASFGKSVDFGKTASDYGRYRAGYPNELYRRLQNFGVGLPGQRVLDLLYGKRIEGVLVLRPAQYFERRRRA